MEWDDLRLVLALSRARTLSGAATALGVTHSTVGRRLRALEKSLSTQLFQQSAGGFDLTAAGEDFSKVAEQVEVQVFGLEGRILGRDVALRGGLRVSIMDLFFMLFHDTFASFGDRFPHVDLTVIVTDNKVSLPRREADVAVRLSNTPPEYLHGRKLGKVVFAPYASRALAERVGPDATMSDYPWIGWDEREDAQLLDEWFAANAPGAKIRIRLNATGYAIREAVRHGLGAHFLPYFDAEGADDLVRIGPVNPDFGWDLWLLTLPELKGNARVSAFMKHIGEQVDPCRDAIGGLAIPLRRKPSSEAQVPKE